ncbi:hypothetical protein NQ314_002955 [Rhamnusium bicolor]|uniref:DUF4371 domain-containing protein n=1 Tax=Rhamnusium bicolor TaxID=1586634 RepID=A0AAV8ZRL3_9CUCU|nr:hypothetical protein NQ314_002955 [Rhamnusium bicolor]
MFDSKAVQAIKTIPYSDTTTVRRTQEMAQDVHEQLLQEIKIDHRFSLQLDESTDVANEAQMIMYAKYFSQEYRITPEILACKSLPGKTTGEEIFNSLKSFIVEECSLNWMWCKNMCTDGAAVLTGHKSGLKPRLSQINPHIKWTH